MKRWSDLRARYAFQRDAAGEAAGNDEEFFGVIEIRAIEEFFDVDMEGVEQ